MSETTYNVIAPENGVPVKAWTKGVPLEDAARKQLLNAAQLPFVFKWIAAMPDVHWGIGATVGSVIPTKGAIIPAAVGVDIGCGMMAVQTSLNARDLPDNLKGIRAAIETAVPHGRTNHGGAGDRGAWHDIPARNQESLAGRVESPLRRYPGEASEARSRQSREPPWHARNRQPLYRGLPGRIGDCLVHAAQRIARSRQSHGELLHRSRAQGHEEVLHQSAGHRPGIFPRAH